MYHKIIIYDDDPDILLATAANFLQIGYEVICRDDCRSLEEDLDTYHPEIILMDNWLPAMSGVQAITLLKSQEAYKHIPIILFSAHSEVEELGKKAGANGTLKKPFDMNRLEKMIEEMLQKS